MTKHRLAVGALSRGLRRSGVGTFSQALAILLLAIGAVFMLFPLYWMITGSFKPMSDAMTLPPEWWPLHPTLRNYEQLFRTAQTYRWILNSFVVASGSAILAVVTSAPAGYAFAKKAFFGSRMLFLLVVLTMALPRQIALIPLFRTMQALHWVDTYQGLLVTFMAYPFGVFLFKQFIESIPSELLEAAKIDGASEIRTFIAIVLPIARPAVGAIAIFAFTGGWNDYMWQLVLITKEELITLPIGVARLATNLTNIDVGLNMAGATVAFLPMLIVFLLFQDYFVKGITMGAVKG